MLDQGMLEKLWGPASENVVLVESLRAAVPLWILELQRKSFEAITELARESGQYIAEHGDVVLYRSRKPGESAKAFNHLARGLACASFVPGGVSFAGLHWCQNHGECESAAQAALDQFPDYCPGRTRDHVAPHRGDCRDKPGRTRP